MDNIFRFLKRLRRNRRLRANILRAGKYALTLSVMTVCLWSMHTYINGIYKSDIQIMAYLNDEPLGLIENMYVLNDAKVLLENEIAKYDYDYEYNLTYKLIKTTEKNFLSHIDCYNILNDMNPHGLVESFVLYIDDTEIGAAKEISEINNALGQILTEKFDEYQAGDPEFETIKFLNSVKIADRNYVKTDLNDTGYFYNLLKESDKLKFIAYKYETFTEVEKYVIEYRESDQYYKGLQAQIIEFGSDGLIEYIYESGYVDGEIQTRILISESYLLETQNIIVLKGTKIPPPAEPTGKFLWPVEYTKSTVITSEFGLQREPYDGEEFHFGIDIIGKTGDFVYASDGGVVIYSGRTASYGNMVRIAHGDKFVTYYAHLSERLVEADEKVYPGQIIGRMGSTGVSTGPHLHFEIRIGSSLYGYSPVDPRDYLP
ncbi:MAG: peptidoglycan DD-metalloendopeptidase family protein [Oscillospiraceae bacterium]|nr:peptidoglycan DD-metalloendopeptidase family protein [Oscillospiraceae bacterium]